MDCKKIIIMHLMCDSTGIATYDDTMVFVYQSVSRKSRLDWAGMCCTMGLYLESSTG